MKKLTARPHLTRSAALAALLLLSCAQLFARREITPPTWQVSPTAEISGFIIEASKPYTNFATAIAILPADARSATVSIASRTSNVTPRFAYVRMRTFNAGGVTEPTASVHVTLPLRNHR